MAQLSSSSDTQQASWYPPSKSRAIIGVTGIILLIILGVVAVLFMGSRTGRTSEWQAVFLSNGNVYFGRITKETRYELHLEEIYYLQISNPLQQDGNPVPKGELQLVKLGNELHGPKDRMIINKDFVLFTEDLKDDGKVVAAISQHAAEAEDSP